MKTLALGTDWDVYVDDIGNIATLDGGNRLAQDVASSVRVFFGELPFNVNRGVEYNKPDENRETLNHQMNQNAKLVEGVSESVVIFEELQNRTLKPVIYVTSDSGEQIVIGE